MDPRQEVLNLQEAALSCFYNGEIHSRRNLESALDVLQRKGPPEMIILDSEIVSNENPLIKNLEFRSIFVPIIATSNEPINQKIIEDHPFLTAIVEKPTGVDSFTYLVKNFIHTVPWQPTHLGIELSVLLKVGVRHFDLYLKLSDTNYVKILHQGEEFLESDAERLSQKGIKKLYIKFSDSQKFLNLLENELTQNVKSGGEERLVIANVETFEQIAKCLKWPPSVIASAEKSVTQAVKILSKNKQIISVLRERLSDPTSPYSTHIGLLTYLCCAISSSIGWVGESGQIKLAMSALIHDAAIDDFYYNNIRDWDKRAADPSDKSPETVKYRMHPIEASKLIKSLESISSDVEQIVSQHHEVKDGSGFPRSLDSGRIGQLPALFIIVEDLVEFIDNGDNIETSITDFIMWGHTQYDSGHFKKLFQAFVETLEN